MDIKERPKTASKITWTRTEANVYSKKLRRRRVGTKDFFEQTFASCLRRLKERPKTASKITWTRTRRGEG